MWEKEGFQVGDSSAREGHCTVNSPKSQLADCDNASRLENRKIEGRGEITTSKTEDSKSVADCQKGRLMPGSAHVSDNSDTDTQWMVPSTMTDLT